MRLKKILLYYSSEQELKKKNLGLYKGVWYEGQLFYATVRMPYLNIDILSNFFFFFCFFFLLEIIRLARTTKNASIFQIYSTSINQTMKQGRKKSRLPNINSFQDGSFRNYSGIGDKISNRKLATFVLSKNTDTDWFLIHNLCVF